MFASLRTVDAAPGNLPVQVTSFVGRDVEVKELTDLVRAHRLVTLTGVGGVGKTRLAVQVAAELVAEFPDGVWLVELAPVGDPAAVPDVVATVLGVTSQAGRTRDRRHRGRPCRDAACCSCWTTASTCLDAAADLVETILTRTTTVKVLATSREGLRVGAEHLWPVPSLDVTAGADVGGRRVVRRTRPSGEAGLRARRDRRRRSGDGDLPPPGRDRAGDRAGRGPDGVDEPPGRAGPSR